VHLTDAQINDYIDGRLSKRERAAVAAVLLADPDLMCRVMRLVLVNEVVSGFGNDFLAEPRSERIASILRTKKWDS
jgi:anti-sigma factor RsiW